MSEMQILREALAAEKVSEEGETSKALFRQAGVRSVESSIRALAKEIEAYHRWRSGACGALIFWSFADIPNILIGARIAQGLTQRDLAERLHIHEQQIHRYERTGYAHASLDRIFEVADALDILDFDKPGRILLPSVKDSAGG